MAKIKVHPRPGALSELLKKKGMTQMDAFQKTHVDRKTLSKIDRGGEVKLETLQQVANKLQVPEGYFSHPVPAADDSDVSSEVEPGTIMLRKLDLPRLEPLVDLADKIEWRLKAQVPDDATRKFLEEFEQAVENFRKQFDIFKLPPEADPSSLRFQLNRLKIADDIGARLERFADHGLVLLGADYLFWHCKSEEGELEYDQWRNVYYWCSKTVLLSVEPGGTHSRRARIYQGKLPPASAANNNSRMITTVYVNGVELPTVDDSDIPSPRTLDDDTPF